MTKFSVCSNILVWFRPEKNTRENTRYNYYLSNIRIRSEHCVGFFKGRLPSVRGLRRQINDSEGLQVAVFWVTACIVIHSFAMDHEAFISDGETDEIFQDGLYILAEEQPARTSRRRVEDAHSNLQERARRHDIELLEGRLKREELKQALFRHLDEMD